MLWLLSLSTLSITMIISISSYYYQKSFSSLNKTNKILIASLAFTIISVITIFVLFYLDLNSIKNNLFKLQSDIILVFVSIINIVFYILIPFLFFHFVNKEKSSEDEGKISINLDTSYFTIFKHYFYYSVLFFSLNIMYLVYYTIFSNTLNSKLIRDTFIPEVLKKYSYFHSDYEVLSFINFSVLILIGKIFSLCYLSYGPSKMISVLIDSLKKTEEIKEEFSNLTNNMNKNSETIRLITSQKVMTGKQLTKQEKNLLKSCKENTTIFQHKQDILEDKYSKMQIFLSYFIIPLKFLLIIICLVINFIILLTFSVVLYNKIFHNLCGASYCGYLTLRINNMSFSLENILFDLVKNNHRFLQFSLVGIVIMFRLSSLIFGLKFRGISLGYQFYSFNDLKSNNTVNFLFYSLFLLQSLSILYDFNYLIPDYSYFFNLPNKCNFLRIDLHDCGLSLIGLYYLKLSINFTGFIYLDIATTLLTVLFSVFFLFYLPIKATYFLFKKNETEINYKLAEENA